MLQFIDASRKFGLPLFALLAALFPLAGCQPRDGIDAYTVPRKTAPRAPVDPHVVREQFDATLVAIVPVGNEAWFFKITDKLVAVERQKEAVLEFLTRLSTEDVGDTTRITWELLEGWSERSEPVPMRLTTLEVPDDAGPMEMAVSTLPYSGDRGDFLVRNVNRWLDQLSQSPLPSATVRELEQEVTTPVGKASVFHLIGRDQTAMSRDPHAGLRATSPAVPPASTAESRDLPAGGGEQSASRQAIAENPYFDFEVPDGWRPGQTFAMRKAAFVVQEGEKAVQVTVIDLGVDEGEQVTDVLANAQRWAGQVGLEVDEAALEAMIEEVTVDGIAGHFVLLEGPVDSAQTAMVQRDDRVWFIKLVGDRELVAEQSDKFREFLDSIRFK